MGYNGDYEGNGANRQRDLVLSTNEFCFIQSKTNGQIKTYCGPITITISQQESMVVFDTKSKRFRETNDFEKARQFFISAPEGWYAALKNPAVDNIHPEAAKAMLSPELVIGHKINIAGPANFALFPGQMARVIRGHRLRSNQYLIARVYDADAIVNSEAIIVDNEGNSVKNETTYHVGQLLIIKGTEVSFYVPPTGIEVIPTANGDYAREAVTLERLEYAILKDEDGEKRYVHGPAVVFPEPTETFVESPKGGSIFRALELSPISGIYIKVIADYTENGVLHKTGEELFITGNEQMIYYPRPEHALIQYDGKYMHHAIAIPAGEGRYILDRLGGEIKTVLGPKMYLPDPRTEVVVKRKLSGKECNLFYPGNSEALKYNEKLSDNKVAKMANSGNYTSINDTLNTAYSTSNALDSLAIFEANANISRGTSYTKPRTITIDTKYDGVVSIDVWTGYAVNVVSKKGHRETVVGPTTRLLDYDETLEAINLSTGTPKTDRTFSTAFLRIKNNKVGDIIDVKTKDYVDVSLRVSYSVDFLDEYKDKWFMADNYVKLLTDRMRSAIKEEAKKYSIQELYSDIGTIIKEKIIGDGIVFEENGMKITNFELFEVAVEAEVAAIINAHQTEMVKKTIKLADAEARLKVVEALAESERKEIDLAAENRRHKAEIDAEIAQFEVEKNMLIKAKHAAAEAAEVEAKKDLQTLLNAINEEEISRSKANNEARLAGKRAEAEIEAAKQEAYAETIKKIVESISPDLVAALTAKANAQLLTEATKSMSPYAIANGESVAETVAKLMRGTTLEGVLSKIQQ